MCVRFSDIVHDHSVSVIDAVIMITDIVHHDVVRLTMHDSHTIPHYLATMTPTFGRTPTPTSHIRLHTIHPTLRAAAFFRFPSLSNDDDVALAVWYVPPLSVLCVCGCHHHITQAV